MATDIFKNKKIYLVPLKVPVDRQDAIRKYIVENGGIWLSSCKDADFAITSLRSAGRISRHIPNSRCLVFHIDWILQCIEQQRWVNPEEHRIHMPQEVIVVPSDDQGSMLKTTDVSDELKGEDDQHLKRTMPRNNIIPISKKRRVTEHDTFDQSATSTESSSDEPNKDSLATKNFQTSSSHVYVANGYDCQRPVRLDHCNRELVAIFETLEHARDLKGDKINSLSYRKAAAALKACPYEIKSGSQAQKIKGIGKKTAHIIDDYVANGHVEDIDLINNDPQYQIMETFYNIHGVGPSIAREWYFKGYKTLEDVQRSESLSQDQRIGIKYYHDFLQRLSRTQIEAIVADFEKVLKEIDPSCEYTVCGSYRRGKSSSSDVDIIITHPDEQVSTGLLMRLLDALQTEGFVTDLLSVGSQAKQGQREGHDHSDLALCVWLPKNGDSIHRRVDLVVTPYTDYPMAVLGWTGSKQFERSIRLYSKREKGLKLTSHGLYDKRSRQKLTVKSERHVFELLDLRWLDPCERNC